MNAKYIVRSRFVFKTRPQPYYQILTDPDETITKFFSIWLPEFY